jgi:uncharacterized membrane protein
LLRRLRRSPRAGIRAQNAKETGESVFLPVVAVYSRRCDHHIVVGRETLQRMPMPKQPENPTQSFVDANIDAIIGAEQTVHRARSPSEVVYGWVGGFIGTLTFVVVQVLCVVLWVAINAGLATSIRPFDLFPFPILSLILTLEALLVAAFVLMKQNSMSKLADRRSHLDLQINLMTERETTKIIRMLLEIGERLDIQHKVLDEESRQLSRLLVIETLIETMKNKFPDE